MRARVGAAGCACVLRGATERAAVARPAFPPHLAARAGRGAAEGPLRGFALAPAHPTAVRGPSPRGAMARARAALALVAAACMVAGAAAQEVAHFNGDETAAFFGFLGAASALVFASALRAPSPSPRGAAPLLALSNGAARAPAKSRNPNISHVHLESIDRF